MRLKLTLQYSGHPYGGWQYQPSTGAPNLPSIQGTVVKALNTLLTTPLLQPKDLTAAGRTDAGVHAHGQVAHVDIPADFANRPAHTWASGLNRFLPKTIRVTEAVVASNTFHARYSAIARHYIYKLWVAPQLRPDLLHHAGHAPPRFGATINLAAMQEAIETLPIGLPTDFTTFRDAECQSKTPICTLTHARLVQHEPSLVEFHLGADHFLHHMVRNLVGTLVQIGMNERPPSFAALLAGQHRPLAGTTFSPAGLYLTQVVYPSLTAV